jgi:hypothetical protein
MKDLLSRLMQEYTNYEFKSNNLSFLRLKHYIFNLYTDYLLVNGDNVADLNAILNQQNNVSCLVILLFEILKHKQSYIKN